MQLALIVLALSVGIYGTGAGLRPVNLFFLWIVAFSAWYLSARVTAIQVAWIIVAYGIVLVAHHDAGETTLWSISNAAASRWLLLSGMVTASALLVTTFRESLLDHEQRFLTAFESSNAPMSIVGLDGVILHPNTAHVRSGRAGGRRARRAPRPVDHRPLRS